MRIAPYTSYRQLKKKKTFQCLCRKFSVVFKDKQQTMKKRELKSDKTYSLK